MVGVSLRARHHTNSSNVGVVTAGKVGHNPSTNNNAITLFSSLFSGHTLFSMLKLLKLDDLYNTN